MNHQAITNRVVNFIKEQNAPLSVYDMAEYPGFHPFLAPFVLMIPLQWFAVYSSLMRGITNLDERVFMGHGILSEGDGVIWP